MLSKLIAGFAMGIWDRFRGDDKLGISKNADALIMAICTLVIIDEFHLSVQTGFFCISYVIAMAMSYGGPWGAALNGRTMTVEMDSPWWQHGIFARNAFAALCARGVLGALVLWPSCTILNNSTPMVAMYVGFVVPPYLARFLFESLNSDQYNKFIKFLVKIHFADPDHLGKAPWNVAECFRGWIQAITIASFMWSGIGISP